MDSDLEELKTSYEKVLAYEEVFRKHGEELAQYQSQGLFQRFYRSYRIFDIASYQECAAQ